MGNYLTPTGLVIPSLEDLLTLSTEEQRALINQSLANGTDTVLGMLNAIDASHDREGWEAIQAIVSSVDPDAAEDVLLDHMCAITGTLRDGPKPSRFSGTHRLRVNLDPATSLTAGVHQAQLTGSSPAVLFTLTESVTNTGAVAADFDVAAECTVNGPIQANAGLVTTIATPISGWNSVTNPKDAIVGALTEGNPSLRNRREQELRQNGSGNAPSLRADLLAYQTEAGEHPILSARVLENTTDLTDAQGLPPHSFEAIVWDGGSGVTDETIATIIRDHRGAGNPSHGTITYLGTGWDEPEKFSRASSVPLVITVTLKFKSGEYAGDDAVKSALALYSQAYQEPATGVGDVGIVAFSDYLATAWKVQGVTRVLSISIQVDGGAVVVNGDALPAPRTVALSDTSLINVVSSAE